MSYFKNKINTLLVIIFVKIVRSQYAPLVSTSQGVVRGLAADDGDYYMYLGIRYAEVNPGNPFGPSSPAQAFEDIFNATDDSAVCPQLGASSSLDCLHLNVFTPQTRTTLLPVLAFIHGGAFVRGSFARTSHGPKYLVRHDVILVTFNYRLDAYGYMCTNNPRVPGNQASKDQLIALQWIRDNIESFGGDPTRVTLSGTSAGGMSTDLMIASDEGPKLFQQAIMQSGAAFLPSYGSEGVRRSPLMLAEYFGLSTNNIDEALDFLASIDPTQVLLASAQLGFQFRPCIEKTFEDVQAFITENWVSKDKVQVADMNIMIGFTDNEALGLFLAPDSDLTDIINESLKSAYTTEHEDFQGLSEVRKFFFGDEEINQSKFKEAIDLRSDNSFAYNSIRSVERYLKSGVGKVFLYLFSYNGGRNVVKSNINTTMPGAAHADESGYLYDVARFGEPNAEDQLMIDRMTEMWTNFVKYGEPTPRPTALVPLVWEPYIASSHSYLHLDSELRAGANLYQKRVAFWNLFLQLNGHLQRLMFDDYYE